jgi:hypothetical protein
METQKLPLSFCIGDFYLVGNLDIEKLNIKRVYKGYHIEFDIDDSDVKRLEDTNLKNTKVQAKKTNIIQINFETGEKKWIK